MGVEIHAQHTAPQVRLHQQRLLGVSRRSFVMCWLLLSSMGCGQRDIHHVTADLDELPSTHATTTLMSSDAIFGRLARIAVAGDRIIVLDRKGDPYFHFLDSRTGALLASRGRRGEGPGEFGRVGSFGVIDGDSLGIFDEGLQRLSRLSLTSTDWSSATVLPLGGISGGIVLAALPLPNGQWLLKTLSDTVQYQIIDGDGKMARSIAIPLLGTEGIPTNDRAMASAQSAFCVSPDGAHMAVAYGYAKRMDIVNLSTTVLTPTTGYAPTDAQWFQVNSRLQLNDSTIYYRDCVMTNNEVYALYLGKNTKSDSAASATLDAAVIHVFGLDGTARQRIALDQGLTTLAFDSVTGRLIGAQASEGKILAVSLPR